MTIEKLLRDAGAASATYMDANLRNLPCRRVHCDEIWSFIGAKHQPGHETATGARIRDA